MCVKNATSFPELKSMHVALCCKPPLQKAHLATQGGIPRKRMDHRIWRGQDRVPNPLMTSGTRDKATQKAAWDSLEWCSRQKPLERTRGALGRNHSEGHVSPIQGVARGVPKPLEQSASFSRKETLVRHMLLNPDRTCSDLGVSSGGYNANCVPHTE